jgi:actin-related protein
MLAEKEAENLAAQKASNDPYSIINIAKKNGEAMAKQSKQQADELEKMSADLMKQANEIENINNIKSDSEQKYNDEADQRRKDAAAKAKETRDKTAEEEKAAREKALAEQKAFEEEFEQGAINLADRAKERRDAEREATLAAYEADRANKNKFHADLAEIEDKSREEKEKKDAEQAEKELARKKQLADSSLEATKSGLQGISDIIGAFAGKSKAQQKKAFEAQKKLNIAMATIDTIKGAVSAFTGMTASIPGPVGLALGAVAAAGVTASGIANVKKISSTQFDSGSSPSGTSTGGGGGAPNLPASQPAQFNVVGNSGTNQLANVEGNTPVKAYVVSGDVTSAQSLERNKIVTATL